ncbi:DUF3027 domain-containing protein, partial [Hamadaea tsunoensis]|uniref:DUF3027 domain-containing protein n=1 Tax=Hamadaea tsunoensis TaxID=53368 RepID=UPI000550237C
MSKNVPVTRTAARPARLDQACADALDLARTAITEVAVDEVGDHQGVVAEGERVVTHYFECLRAGYRGWQWAVTVTRISRSKHVTVCETVLLPGQDALLAPNWLPWEERLRPGDLGVGDLLPTAPDDDRLVQGYLLADDPALDEDKWELGLGRPRLMSKEGREEAAQRWYDGDSGPGAPIAEAAPRSARCVSCGFMLPMAGRMRQMFGVCANVFAPDDGKVVSLDHGCGAHSEIVVDTAAAVEALPTAYDDGAVEEV